MLLVPFKSLSNIIACLKRQKTLKGMFYFIYLFIGIEYIHCLAKVLELQLYTYTNTLQNTDINITKTACN